MSKSKHSTLKVLVVEPCKAPYAEEISAGLESLQQMVGGLIQALYPFEEPDAAIITNDEGKLIGLPWNRPLFDEDGNIYDILVGTFLVVGLTKDNFGSLSDEQIQKYTKYTVLSVPGNLTPAERLMYFVRIVANSGFWVQHRSALRMQTDSGML